MPNSTDGYAQSAAQLLVEYDALPFEAIHGGILDLLPPAPAEVLDIGAGSGRDAAWFAARGHRVTAAEPVAEMRDGARRLHPSPAISWCDDALPELPRLSMRRSRFDLVMMTAVYMHLDESERAAAMPTLAGLLRPGGQLILSLRHGPVPEGRRMHPVDPAEVRALAAAAGLVLLRERAEPPAMARNVAAGVNWTRLAFRRPPG